MWSWILTVTTCVAFWVAGKRRIGWLLALANEALWCIYAVVTGQIGFIVMAIIFIFVYWRNWRIGK